MMYIVVLIRDYEIDRELCEGFVIIVSVRISVI